jgi:hypothetical protein
MAVVTILQLELMRPDSVLIVTAMLTLPGKKYHYLLHLSVSVPVVVGKIHLFCSQFTGLSYHFPSTDIQTISIILTIVGIVHGKRYRTHHIKVYEKLSAALVLEVVVYTSLKTQFMHKILFVGNPLIEFSRMFLFKASVGE